MATPLTRAWFLGINTPALEYAPAVSADELTIYFTRLDQRFRPLGDPSAIGIWVATRGDRNAAFGTPRQIAAITGFVEAPTVTPDGCAIYFHQRIGGKFRLMRAEKVGC